MDMHIGQISHISLRYSHDNVIADRVFKLFRVHRSPSCRDMLRRESTAPATPGRAIQAQAMQARACDHLWSLEVMVIHGPAQSVSIEVPRTGPGLATVRLRC